MSAHTFMEMRNVVHHAVQVPSAFGHTHLDGDEHERSSLSWDPRLGALVGHPAAGLRAGLRVADLTWIMARDGQVVDARPVAGHTLDEGYQWLQYQATEHSMGRLRDERPAPVGYDLPEHEVTDGACFPNGGQEQLAMLDRWFATAAAILEQVRRDHDGASAVRCWPHHFDIATLLKVDDERSVGVGMTPGDAGIGEAYFYVTPWPYPEDRTGPQLPAGGRWHTEGWFGATLRVSELQGGNTGIVDFVQAGIAACRAKLD